MKKLHLYLILLVLLLVTLACSLPFNQTEDEPSNEPSESLTEEPVNQPTAIPTNTRTVKAEEVFQVGSYSMLLPGSFIVSDDPVNVPKLNELLDIMDEWSGEDFGGMTAIDQENIVLVGYDSQDPNPIPTSLLVLKNEEYAGAPLSLMNMFAGAILGDAVDLLQSDTLQMGNRQVIRWITGVNFQGEESYQAIYFFNDYNMLWIIVFVTDPALMNEKLSTFNDAVNSFTLN